MNQSYPLKCNAKCVTIDEGGRTMEKRATLNLRVNPDVKRDAESVLSQLGISMSTAVDMYLRQIKMTGGIPFPIVIKNAPDRVNAEMMTASQIRDKIQRGLDDIDAGRTQDLDDVIKKKRGNR